MLPLLIRIQNTQTNADENRAFTSSPVRIGRNELNDLVLREPFVSQWHAVVWFDDRGARFVDLGSTNGTVVNGQRAEKNVPVPLDDRLDLRIGPLRLYFLRAPVQPEAVNAPMRQSMFFIAPQIEATKENELPEARTMVFNAMQHRQLGPEDRSPTSLIQKNRHSREINEHLDRVATNLGAAHHAYRQAWVALFHQIQQQIGGLPPSVKEGVLMALVHRFPNVGREKDIREMAKNLGIGPAALGEVDPDEFIQRLGGEPSEDPALDMERVGALLEACAQAYVELRKGYEQFGKDMAVRTVSQDTELHRAQSSKEVLAYLLDGKSDGPARVNDMNRAFAEIAIHQVALLSGLMEGVRSLLQRLSPSEVAGKNSNGNGAAMQRSAPGTGIVDLLIPFRPYGLWNKYVARHKGFVEEDRFTREVFGRAFARAYYMVTGGQYEGSAPASPPGAPQTAEWRPAPGTEVL
ncbi:MAG: FHA domain-containing protein [Myxococcota bacterium]